MVAEEFAYLPFGPRTAMTFGSGLFESRSYDARYRLDTWRLGENVLRCGHTFDDDGNLVSRIDEYDSGNSRTFGYDALHRLIHAEGPWGAYTGCANGQVNQTYTYDANGNRQCKDETGAPIDYLYATGTNKLASTEIDEEELASYSYDANGNTTSDGTHTYEYNDANRLEMVDMGETAYSAYDGDHHRAIKATEDMTYYFYDPAGRLLTEVRIDDELNYLVGRDYVYVHGAPAARVDWLMNEGFARSGPEIPLPTWSDALFFYHTDHLGTPIAMTSGSSVVMWQAEYLPFGGLVGDAPVVEEIENNLRFPGQYFDAETGLHQNWFRDYSSPTGRYFESDLLGLIDGPNPYVYAQGNPILLNDRRGLSTEMCTRMFYPLPWPAMRHCFVQFNGNPNDTLSFSSQGVGGDPAPEGWFGQTCTQATGSEDDLCVSREMLRCQAGEYDFTGFNCCHCVERALRSCGLAVPVDAWPNWPVNPGPVYEEKGWTPAPVTTD